MTACAASCDHLTALHGICRRHGEARHYVLGGGGDRRCDCPPMIIQTPTEKAPSPVAPATVGTAPGPHAGQVTGRRAPGAAPQVSPSRSHPGNTGGCGAPDASAAPPGPKHSHVRFRNDDGPWSSCPPDCPVTVAVVLEEVLAEVARADALHGAETDLPNGTGGEHWRRVAVMDRWTTQQATAAGTVTWLHILREEVSEAFAETDPNRLRTELLQVAAVAAKWARAINRRGGPSCSTN